MFLNGDDVDVVFLAASNNLLKFMPDTSIGLTDCVGQGPNVLYVATLRAWPMFGALRPGAGSETWLRIAPL